MLYNLTGCGVCFPHVRGSPSEGGGPRLAAGDRLGSEGIGCCLRHPLAGPYPAVRPLEDEGGFIPTIRPCIWGCPALCGISAPHSLLWARLPGAEEREGFNWTRSTLLPHVGNEWGDLRAQTGFSGVMQVQQLWLHILLLPKGVQEWT